MHADCMLLLLCLNQSAAKSRPGCGRQPSTERTLQVPSHAVVQESWSVACSHMNTGLVHRMLYAAFSLSLSLLCCCCPVCSEANCCRSAADDMASSTKVSEEIDHCTTSADASLMAPLSRAVVLVCCAGRVWPEEQKQCARCRHWLPRAKLDGHTECWSCRKQEQEVEEYLPSAAAAPTPPRSPSPPLSMFGRPSGCVDQLTTIERAAIVTLHGVGWTGRDIAQELHCSENTVSLWLQRWKETRSLEDSERSGRPRCTTDETDQNITLYSDAHVNALPRRHGFPSMEFGSQSHRESLE